MRTLNSLLLACLLFGAGVAGCGPDDVRGLVKKPGAGRIAEPDPVRKRALTRDEFREMVEGKSKEEILKLAGKPSTTDQYNDGSEMWRYSDVAIDPITGKKQDAVLHFDKKPNKLRALDFF